MKLSVFTLFLLFTPLLSAGNRLVFLNQDGMGNFTSLSDTVPEPLSLDSASLVLDGVSLESGFQDGYEFWISGQLSAIFSELPPLSPVTLDEYNEFGEYVNTHELTGLRLPVKVTVTNRDQKVLMEGYQRVQARQSQGDEKSFEITFQLVYPVSREVLETDGQPLEPSQLKVSMHFVSTREFEAAHAGVFAAEAMPPVTEGGYSPDEDGQD